MDHQCLLDVMINLMIILNKINIFY